MKCKKCGSEHKDIASAKAHGRSTGHKEFVEVPMPMPVAPTPVASIPTLPYDIIPAPPDIANREISSSISNITGSTKTHCIVCPVCDGLIVFNLQELEDRKSIGQNTSVYCPSNTTAKKQHYHPLFPGNAWKSYPAQQIYSLTI